MTDFLNEELWLENTSEVRLLSQKVFKELFNILWVHLDTDVQRSVSNESQYLLRIFKAYNCLRDFLKGEEKVILE